MICLPATGRRMKHIVWGHGLLRGEGPGVLGQYSIKPLSPFLHPHSSADVFHIHRSLRSWSYDDWRIHLSEHLTPFVLSVNLRFKLVLLSLTSRSRPLSLHTLVRHLLTTFLVKTRTTYTLILPQSIIVFEISEPNQTSSQRKCQNQSPRSPPANSHG